MINSMLVERSNRCGAQPIYVIDNPIKQVDSFKQEKPKPIINNIVRKEEPANVFLRVHNTEGAPEKEKVYKPCEKLLRRLKKEHANKGLYL